MIIGITGPLGAGKSYLTQQIPEKSSCFAALNNPYIIDVDNVIRKKYSGVKIYQIELNSHSVQFLKPVLIWFTTIDAYKKYSRLILLTL